MGLLGRLGDPYSQPPPPVNQGQTEQDDDRDRGDWSDDMREYLDEDPDDVVEDFIDIEEPPLPDFLPDAIPDEGTCVPHNRRLGPASAAQARDREISLRPPMYPPPSLDRKFNSIMQSSLLIQMGGYAFTVPMFRAGGLSPVAGGEGPSPGGRALLWAHSHSRRRRRRRRRR